jgi:hypothetical protein
MTTTFPANEYSNLRRVLQDLQAIIERENKRPQDCQQLAPDTRDLIEYEILPALEGEVDYDPTPQHLYDHSGGEPPMTTAEIWMEAHRAAQLLQS